MIYINMFVILICDHQEKHNKDELTHGAGGRIREAEGGYVMYDDFKITGESNTTGRLRTQEDIHQKASAVLSDEVSIIVMSGLLWLSSASYSIFP